jgi:hypothetical protein
MQSHLCGPFEVRLWPAIRRLVGALARRGRPGGALLGERFRPLAALRCLPAGAVEGDPHDKSAGENLPPVPTRDALDDQNQLGSVRRCPGGRRTSDIKNPCITCSAVCLGRTTWPLTVNTNLIFSLPPAQERRDETGPTTAWQLGFAAKVPTPACGGVRLLAQTNHRRLTYRTRPSLESGNRLIASLFRQGDAMERPYGRVQVNLVFIPKERAVSKGAEEVRPCGRAVPVRIDSLWTAGVGIDRPARNRGRCCRLVHSRAQRRSTVAEDWVAGIPALCVHLAVQRVWTALGRAMRGRGCTLRDGFSPSRRDPGGRQRLRGVACGLWPGVWKWVLDGAHRTSAPAVIGPFSGLSRKSLRSAEAD